MKRTILAIETSCDETGLAILECSGGLKGPRFKIKKEVIASQIKVHAPWGGVVPNLAKREHIKNLPLIYKKIFGRDEKSLWQKIDAITVTVGPGLEPALWTGITFAKELARAHKKPLVGSNHMEGHLFSPLLTATSRPQFPAVALVVSGGHTMLLKLESLAKWKLLGETRDDAAGEAFDKVARILGLAYPGGPEVSKHALRGKASIPFPQPMLHSKDYDFSFSGLKTAVFYYLKDAGYGRENMSSGAKGKKVPDKLVDDIAASFEKTAVEVLTAKTFRAVDAMGARSLWLAGGVAANKALRKALSGGAKKRGIPFLVPDSAHNTDNGAMIGAAAYIGSLRKKTYPLVARGDLGI